MKTGFRVALLAGTAIVVVGAFAMPGIAMAGNTANLVGTAAGTTPPIAGETVQVLGNTNNSIWDAADGTGSVTSDMEFVGGGIGNASIKLEDSTGAAVVRVRDIDVVDDENQSIINIDATNGDVDVEVAGDVTNSDDTDGNDVKFIMTDGGNTSTLIFNGNTPQAATATIDGGGANNGNLVVRNAFGVTFYRAIGGTVPIDTVVIGGTATNSSAEFHADIDANSIVLGGGGAATTATVTFDTSDGPISVGGTVDGDGTDTAEVIINGGDTLTAGDAWGNGTPLDSVLVTGAGTSFVTTSTLDVTLLDLGADTSFSAGGAVTGDIAVSGTGAEITIANGLTITGGIDNTSGSDGAGVLILSDTGGTTTITGDVGATNALSSIEIGGAAADVSFGGTVAAATISIGNTGIVTFNDDVTGDVNFSSTGGGTAVLGDGADIAGAVDNTTGADGDGTLSLLSNGVNTSTVSGAVGGTNSLAIVAIDGTGETVFSSTVNADDIDFNAAGSVVFSGDVTSANGIDFENRAGTLTFSDGVDYAGDIFSTGGANGTVEFDGATTVTGDLGAAAGTGIATINMNGTSGQTVTVTGDVFGGDLNLESTGAFAPGGDVTLTGAFTFNADASVTFVSNSTFTATGMVNGSGADGAGSVTFSGDTTVTANIGTGANTLKSLTLAGDATTVAQTGNLAIADTTDIGNNTMTVTGTVVTAAGQTLNTIVSGADTDGNADEFGNIVAQGAVTVDADTIITVDVQTDEFIANDSQIVLIDGSNAGSGGVATLTAGNITDNSFLLDFYQDTDTDSLILNVDRTVLSSAATTSNNEAVGVVLENLGDNGNAAIDLIQGNLVSAATQTDVNNIFESVQPTVDGGNVDAALGMTDTAMGLATERMAMMRSGDNITGIATGNGGQGYRSWGQVFGNAARQDTRNNIDGYDADGWGFAVGIDTQNMSETGSIGVAFTYGRTKVDSKNFNRTRTDINTYQATLYGDYNIGERTYISGMAAYAYNDNETLRHNVGGAGGPTAAGEFEAHQFSARGEIGQDYKYGAATVTPSLMANWQHYDPKEYTETGSGANLHVDTDSIQMFEMGLGLNFGWEHETLSGAFFQPTIHGGARYELLDNKVQSEARFVGGGTGFTSESPSPARFTTNMGAGIRYYGTTNWEFTGNYDFDMKPDYTNQAGYVRAAYKF